MNVLITGCSSGIGEAIAQRLIIEGHKIVLMARRREKLLSLANELDKKMPGYVQSAPGDVGKQEDCERAVTAGIKSFGHIDALINAAGGWVDKNFIDVTYTDIEQLVKTDVLGATNISRAVITALIRSGGGRILHINGLHGFIRQHSPVLYTTVESAVRGLCESLRWEAVSNGVHVTLITLGSVANDEPVDPDPSKLIKNGIRYRLSRKEVADAVLFRFVI
jgi:NADP-dependent 3-hydroxy acid dehydrogenase YdfG